MRLFEIGRHRCVRRDPVAIAFAERLPGEVILPDIEIAGELFEAVAQHLHHPALLVAEQRAILCRGDAEAEQRRRVARDPADEALLEDRGEPRFEDRPLFVHRIGGEDVARIDAVESREQLGAADEAAEQSLAIEVAREAGDPLPSDQVTAFPVTARRLVEIGGDIAAIGIDIFGAVGLTEEAIEMRMIGQLPRGGELEPAERDMRSVEIDRGDFRGIGGEVGEDVANRRWRSSPDASPAGAGALRDRPPGPPRSGHRPARGKRR